MAVQRIGGSFAPPLTDELLAKYKSSITALPESPERDALVELYTCCERWWNLPESKGAGTAHPVMGVIVPLDKEIQDALFDSIPWKEQLDLMGQLFDKLKGETRHMAYHLLWHAVELEKDREPLTNDKL